MTRLTQPVRATDEEPASEPGAGPDLVAAPRQGPAALGRPIDPAVADAAADWFTRLHARQNREQEHEQQDRDHTRWRAWHDAHPDHARAWRHLETVIGALPGLNPGGAAYRTLSIVPRSGQRHRLLGLAAGLVVAGGGGWLATRSQPWQAWTADYASATGTRRRFILPDGTEMTLGTGGERRVRLLAGEALFATAHPPGPLGHLPFVVETQEGRVRALGTRFTVRQEADASRVAVLEGAVEITPSGGGAPLRLQAHQAATFQAGSAGPAEPAHEHDSAWSHGLLVADNQRLGDFLAELSRYRRGWLHADPAVADLRFSGVFPLGDADNATRPVDTDAILGLLPNSLPVQVRWRTRWWVTVEPG
ncbi:MAG: Protein FecR [Paracidovorax wautersii]|uniref:Protein FecR n=1 Tax=Paracidovorax wautersii TaxID=1177982 RepID=A0A7V8FQG3_9BURK|nr:MAG: Protein FecR [Paracidovorax wautersii]